MRIAIFALCCALVLLRSGATFSRPREKEPHINVAFFLGTNDDMREALESMAETLCVQDKVAALNDNSPEAWLAAASKCADSYRDPQAEHSSNDGGWREYIYAAMDEITQLCAEQANTDELCRYFR